MTRLLGKLMAIISQTQSPPATIRGWSAAVNAVSMIMAHIPPVALSIAGSDCSAGAGIQADLKTFQHFEVHGLTAVTCVVSETSQIVEAVHPLPTAIVAGQVALMLKSFPVAAIKTGMLFSAELIQAVADQLKAHPGIPLVIDPVMVASSGSSLLEPDAVQTYCDALFPLARVITPNLPEAEALLGAPIGSEAEMAAAAQSLSDQYNTAILIKGGHLGGNKCIDLLAEQGTVERFVSPRIPVDESHGTGCTLSAALAANLAQGLSLKAAVEASKAYLSEALRSSFTFQKPTGGPIQALNQGTVKKGG